LLGHPKETHYIYFYKIDGCPIVNVYGYYQIPYRNELIVVVSIACALFMYLGGDVCG
jgi:hypothetical protein